MAKKMDLFDAIEIVRKAGGDAVLRNILKIDPYIHPPVSSSDLEKAMEIIQQHRNEAISWLDVELEIDRIYRGIDLSRMEW